MTGTPESPAAVRKEASIIDVAREAGVSAQTVSRVATGKDVVRAETRDRVVAAMRRLGYRPNGAARALKSGRFRSVGVIMFSLATYGNMHTLEAIAREATASGYSLTLLPLDGATQSNVSGAFARFDEYALDGILILVESHLLDTAEVELPSHIPVVVIDSSAGHDRPVVDNDQAQGARLATEHLLSLGHETVWHVAGPDRSFSAQRRRESWRETLIEHGAHVPDVLVGDWSAQSGAVAGEQLARRRDVTAIFAANDAMALGVMNAFHRAGRAIPASVSIVGFDDMAEAASFWPPLTTVRQDFDTVGASSLRSLIGEIEGRSATAREVVGTQLIVRGTSAHRPTSRGW